MTGYLVREEVEIGGKKLKLRLVMHDHGTQTGLHKVLFAIYC